MESSLPKEYAWKIRDVVAIDDWTEADHWPKVTATTGRGCDVYEILVRSE